MAISINAQQTVAPTLIGAPVRSASVAPAAFGAAQAQGTADLGKGLQEGLSKVSASLNEIDEQENIRVSKKMDRELADFISNLTNGDGTAENVGYLNLNGQLAVEAQLEASAAIDAFVASQISDTANGRIEGLYVDSSAYRVDGAMASINSHAATQRIVGANNESDAHLELKVSEGVAGRGDAALTQLTFEEISRTAGDKAGLNGWGEAETASYILQQQSQFVHDMIAVVSVDDTQGAWEIYGNYAHTMDPLLKAKTVDGIEAQERANLAAEDAADRRREEDLENRQEATKIELLQKLFPDDGSIGSVDQATLNSLIASGDLSPTDFQMFVREQEDGPTVPDYGAIVAAQQFINSSQNITFAQVIDQGFNLVGADYKTVYDYYEKIEGEGGGILSRFDVKTAWTELDKSITDHWATKFAESDTGMHMWGNDQVAATGLNIAKSAARDRFETLVINGVDASEARDQAMSEYAPIIGKEVFGAAPKPAYWGGYASVLTWEITDANKSNINASLGQLKVEYARLLTEGIWSDSEFDFNSNLLSQMYQYYGLEE